MTYRCVYTAPAHLYWAIFSFNFAYINWRSVGNLQIELFDIHMHKSINFFKKDVSDKRNLGTLFKGRKETYSSIPNCSILKGEQFGDTPPASANTQLSRTGEHLALGR